MKRIVTAITALTIAMLFSACSKGIENSEATVPESQIDISESAELQQKEVNRNDNAMAEFLVSEEGLDFQKAANKAAIAYLRNDKEKLSQYMVDPNYETGLSEDGADLLNDLDYIVLKIPSFNITSDNNGVYPVSYEYVIEGIEIKMYLDLGLQLTGDGWKVEYIDVQG